MTSSSFDGADQDGGPKDHTWRRHDPEEDPSAGVKNHLEESDFPISRVQEKIRSYPTVVRRGAERR